MKLLVIGKNGQLASALRTQPRAPDLEISFAGRPELDLAEAGGAKSAIKSARPDFIINAAAYTAVDRAEQEPERAFAINERGAGEIAAAAASIGARLLHVSTDYVFDGRSNQPLTEASPTGPVNVYGRSKLAGEEAVRQNCPDAAILRTSWLYSPFGNNFVRTVLRLAKEPGELRIVDDQIGCPTGADDLAGALLAIVGRWLNGDSMGLGETYHFAGSEHCSWAEFARGILEASTEHGGTMAKVVPIATKDYPTAAARPGYTVLDCSKFDRDFGLPRPSWRKSVRPVVAEMMGAQAHRTTSAPDEERFHDSVLLTDRREERVHGGADRLKLLFILPFAPDLRGSHGGARATAAIVDMLSQRHRVRVLYLDAPEGPAPRELPGNCEEVLAIPLEMRERSAIAKDVAAARQFLWGGPRWAEESWSPAVANQLAAAAEQFEPDIAQFEHHVMAQYIPAVRAACPNAACIVTEHEPGITADLGLRSSLTLRRRLGGLGRRRAWIRYERRTLRAADAIIVFTESDSGALKRLLGENRPPIAVIPLRLPSPDGPQGSFSTPVKSDFLFIGNFRHPPNVDAARRLVGRIFPMILRTLPDAKLLIVGPDPSQDLVDAGSDHVIVTGLVDDPSVYLAGASVVLVPLRQGGGIRVKMIEACAAGKAIVASPVALEGLSLKPGRDVVLANTDREFAANAIKMFRDAEARTGLERASRRWWEEENDPARWAAEYDRLYADLGKAG